MCLLKAVADPGFPIGEAWNHKGGCGPPTRALFGENVCKNERIGSRRGWRVPGTPPLDPPMQGAYVTFGIYMKLTLNLA